MPDLEATKETSIEPTTEEPQELSPEDQVFIDNLLGGGEKKEDTFFTGETKVEDDKEQPITKEPEPEPEPVEEEPEPLTEEEITQIVEIAEESSSKVEKLESELNSIKEEMKKDKTLMEESTKYWNKIMADPIGEKTVKALLRGDDIGKQFSESALASLESEIDALPKEVTADVQSQAPEEFSMNNFIHDDNKAGLIFKKVE